MARARNIKPAFFTNEILGTLDPIIPLLFAGLWCLADKEGILEDRPLRIKGELFPYREELDINGYLTVLERHDFILRYVVAGKGYIQVVNFEKHQHPHHTEKPKGFPKPEAKQPLTPLCNGYTPSDSLIPDSLIPDSVNLPTEGVAAPPSAEQELFSRGVQILTDRNVKEKNARSMIGLMRKRLTDVGAMELLIMVDEQDISDPVSWINACMNRRNGNGYKSQRDKLAETGAALTGRVGDARTFDGSATEVG